MKKCKLCGRRKELHHYAYSLRSEDGHKCACNECKNKGSKEPAVEVSKPHHRTWDRTPYTGEPPGFQRNEGHKHIKSKGIRC